MKTPAARAYTLAFGAAVRLLRGARDQAEVARAAGLSQPALSRVEVGLRLPNAFTAGKLSSVLGVGPDGLHRIVEEALRRAPEVAAVVLRREVTPEELAGLPAADGLFLFLTGVVIRER